MEYQNKGIQQKKNQHKKRIQILPLCCVSLVAPTLNKRKNQFLGALWVLSAPRIAACP